jgi:hypothetical protein
MADSTVLELRLESGLQQHVLHLLICNTLGDTLEHGMEVVADDLLPRFMTA